MRWDLWEILIFCLNVRQLIGVCQGFNNVIRLRSLQEGNVMGNIRSGYKACENNYEKLVKLNARLSSSLLSHSFNTKVIKVSIIVGNKTSLLYDDLRLCSSKWSC